MSGEDFEFEIDVKTQPRPVRVGDDTYYLVPEIMGPEYIETFNKFDTKRLEISEKIGEKYKSEVDKSLFSDEEKYEAAVAEKASRDPEYLRQSRELMKTMVSKFMTDDSRSRFMEINYPDRVYTIMINKIIGIYTGKKSTSENGSGGQ